ncbi:hypothetical protein ACFLWZ_07105 [Chloroflexota bacterium]
MCSSDKENRSRDDGEACQTSSRTMPGKDLENLKKDAQILTVRSNIASVTIVCFSKLIYAVVKVLKSSI